MTLDRHKYITFKREEFEAWLEKANPLKVPIDPLMDAVVIRKQDTFAASAFYSYAAAITGALAMAHEDDGTTMTPERRTELEDIADMFAGLGDECRLIARVGAGKVPTP